MSDLFPRRVVGWARCSTQPTDLVLQALPAAMCRRKPDPGLLLHLDQGIRFAREGWRHSLRAHNIVCSTRRRENGHDNIATESFFQLFRRECIERWIYGKHDKPRADVFQYIEMSYNPMRRYRFNVGLSPIEQAGCDFITRFPSPPAR